MKCPKCLYIGFETGDRCKNCGYDFSLLNAADLTDADPPELQIRDLDEARQPAAKIDLSLAPGWAAAAVDRFREAKETAKENTEPLRAPGTIDATLDPIDPVMMFSATPAALSLDFVATAGSVAPSTAGEDPALPLFAPDSPYPYADDEPLIKLPAAPRPPLAVRRTPDTPRLRTTPNGARPKDRDEAVLQFGDEPEGSDAVVEFDASYGETGDEASVDAPVSGTSPRVSALRGLAPSTIAARVIAAAIDYAILLGIDAAVLYLTLRLTGLDVSEWRVLPLLPLLAFLIALKVAYFGAFTAAGGQTIGKMATHIRVVSDDGRSLQPARAFRRALLGLISIATVGAPFLPALTDPARRGVHDRAAGTRVVGLTR